MTSLKERIRKSRLFFLYNPRDPYSLGRLIMLSSTATANLASVLTTGLFYTGFLIDNGINLTSIGILTFVPPITSCFTLLSPLILERFKKRKWLLFFFRMMYYSMYILGGTLVPLFVHDPAMKVVCFVVVVFLGHSFNALSSSGFSAWHINFMPDNVRAEHIGINSLVANISAQGFGLIFALIADAFAGTPGESGLFITLRFIAYAVGIFDCILLLIPREFPYGSSGEKPRIRDIFVKSLRNRKFAGCIMLLCMWTFAYNLPASVLNYRILEELKLSYSYIQVINVIYPIFVFAFLVPCQRFIKKLGWLETMSIGICMDIVSFFAYGLVVPGNVSWLFPTVRIVQHLSTSLFSGIPVNNLVYFNLPDEDRTHYLSFYILANNAASFLGLMCGTWFVTIAPDFSFHIGGIQVGNIQFLLMLQSLMLLVMLITVQFTKKKLRPSTM